MHGGAVPAIPMSTTPRRSARGDEMASSTPQTPSKLGDKNRDEESHSRDPKTMKMDSGRGELGTRQAGEPAPPQGREAGDAAGKDK